MWIHALASYANSSFWDSLLWFQLETQFVYMIIALKLDFFYYYVTLSHFPPLSHTFSRKAFCVCPHLITSHHCPHLITFHHCRCPLEWIAERQRMQNEISHICLYHIWISVVLLIRETSTGPCLAWEHASPPNTCGFILRTLKFSVSKVLYGS